MLKYIRQPNALSFYFRQAALVLLGTAMLSSCPANVVSAPLAAGSVASPAAKAEEENPHVWKPRIRSVAVFKNGLGFFMREGETQLRDGWCVTEEVPPATFGTLAIYSRDENATVDIVGSGSGEVVEFDGRDAGKDLATRRARLEACKFLKVQLHYKHKGKELTAAGKLASVGPEFVVLENEAQDFAVPLDGISKLQVLELPLRIHVAGSGDKPAQDPSQPARGRQAVDARRNAPAEKSLNKPMLGMAYLRQGITWIPDYTLKVLDDDTAELTLRGTLVNEAEDLIHSDVHLVVGVPHFVHTGYLAPLAVGQVLRSIGASVGNLGVPPGVQSQIMNRAAIVRNDYSNGNTATQFEPATVVERPAGAGGGDLARAVGNLPQLDGAAATDYTVYTKNDLTLRRGEKAILTLFVKRIKYTHIYRWSPPARMEHALVLLNQTTSAWTTGPCLALSDDQPLSEDLLKYTPKGGRGELLVTAAINVAHDQSEREVDRKLKTYSPQKDVNFDLVTLEGKLKLRNYEKRAVDIVISNPVTGKPLSADSGGTLSVDSSKLRLLEREGSVHWKIRLEAGEEKALTYQYERYVPSN
jgi:hypothetical protein